MQLFLLLVKVVRINCSLRSKHYAFQAHLGFDPKAIDLLIAADGENLRKQNKKSYLLFKHLNNCVPTIIF